MHIMHGFLYQRHCASQLYFDKNVLRKLANHRVKFTAIYTGGSCRETQASEAPQASQTTKGSQASKASKTPQGSRPP